MRANDPPYMTPHLKLLLRRRNRLNRRGKQEAASALADRTQSLITKSNALTFQGLCRGSTKLWTETRRLRTGHKTSYDQRNNNNITADSLNKHYSKISTDDFYTEPRLRQTAAPSDPDLISEHFVFTMLTGVRGSSVGQDGVPPWLLSSMAHLLAAL